MTPDTGEEWIPIAEAARATGMSKKAIRSRVDRGSLPHRKTASGLRLVPVDRIGTGGGVESISTGAHVEVTVTVLRVRGPVEAAIAVVRDGLTL